MGLPERKALEANQEEAREIWNPKKRYATIDEEEQEDHSSGFKDEEEDDQAEEIENKRSARKNRK